MYIYSHKNLPYEPFVYLIGWSNLNVFYIGSRYGKTIKAHPSQLWTTYFTSSKYVKEFSEINGEPDIIRIEKTFNDPIICRTYEAKLNFRMKVVSNKKFLNRSYGCGKFMCIGHTEETKKKMRISSLKIEHKKASNETREKLRISHLGKIQSPETKLKKSLAGSHNQTDETRLKISIANTGKNRTAETRKNISNSMHKTWKLISPDKTEYITKQLTKFCEERDLNAACMSKVARGYKLQHRGWLCIKLD